MPKVSIIIPMYNMENYIKTCLDSVMNQTMKDYEVIVIDDGSVDHSYDKALEYQGRYPQQMRVYKQENAGQGAVRNNGVRIATGEYILFVDSDDTVSEYFVEKAYKMITESQADIGIFDAVIVDENRQRKEDMIGCHCPDCICTLQTYPQLLFEYPAPWNKIYKRSLFTQSNLGYPTHMWYEDLVGASMFYTVANKIAVVHEPLYYYMQRSDSVMHSKVDARNMEILKAMDMIQIFYRDREIYDVYQQELEYLAIYHILVAAASRTVKADAKSSFPGQFMEYMNNQFPKWRQNIYLNRLSVLNRVKLQLLDKKQYWILHLLYCMQK